MGYCWNYDCLPLASSGQLQLAKIFSDNMVLQRDKPIHIWGRATPGEKLEVRFANRVRVNEARNDLLMAHSMFDCPDAIHTSPNKNILPRGVFIFQYWPQFRDEQRKLLDEV